MKQKDFGALLKALRRSGTDPSGKSWTRDSLGRALKLSSDQVGRLERGERKFLDLETMSLLADCFNLTGLEKKEFFYAATGITDAELFSSEEPTTQLENLLGIVENLRLPVMILDVYADIVAINGMMADLYMFTPELTGQLREEAGGFNLLYILYANKDHLEGILGQNLWREVTNIEVLLFRRSTLRYRNSAYYNKIFNELLKFKQFDIDWYTNHKLLRRYDLTYEAFQYNHSVFGPLHYIALETKVHTSAGELLFLQYSPADEVTAKTFSSLAEANGNRYLKVAPWPTKPGFRES